MARNYNYRRRRYAKKRARRKYNRSTRKIYGYTSNRMTNLYTINRSRRFGNQYIRIKRKVQYSGPSGNGFPVLDWNFTSSTTVDNYDQYNFTVQLANISNSAEYTALYELYRIRHVKCKVYYMSSTEFFAGAPSGGVQALNGVQMMGWCDPDDITAYANSGAGWRTALESNRAGIKRFPNVRNNTYSLYLKNPKILTDVFSGGTDTYVRSSNPGWLSTANTTVEHYGFKFFANAQPNTGGIIHQFRFMLTFYIDFKSAK